ncbi:MAG: hypothetical protein KAI67_00800 [Candidatus Pacebacteria bacterium]|nr:hypothetical protein [Candidatus Paceibacterota bacterium]
MKIGNKKMYGFPEMEVSVLSDLVFDSRYYTITDDEKYFLRVSYIGIM